jgi:hypothetical protein
VFYFMTEEGSRPIAERFNLLEVAKGPWEGSTVIYEIHEEGMGGRCSIIKDDTGEELLGDCYLGYPADISPSKEEVRRDLAARFVNGILDQKKS